MSSRFFSQDSIQSADVRLTDEQAHHLLHVMRLQTGDSIIVFDGSGWEATATVTETRKKEVRASIIERFEVDRELPVKISLAVALPKGDRQKVLVEKLVEVGVSSLIPIKTQRAVAQPTDKALDRLSKNVVAASKQCGRNRLMKISTPLPFADLVGHIDFANHQKLIATTHGPTVPLATLDHRKEILVAIGPEGGFSLDENELAASHGFVAIQLGKRILRVETAAIVAATLLGLS